MPDCLEGHRPAWPKLQSLTAQIFFQTPFPQIPLTGRRRNRVFVYEDYLGILSEGG
jgi:hypothetical protein